MLFIKSSFWHVIPSSKHFFHIPSSLFSFVFTRLPTAALILTMAFVHYCQLCNWLSLKILRNKIKVFFNQKFCDNQNNCYFPYWTMKGYWLYKIETFNVNKLWTLNEMFLNCLMKKFTTINTLIFLNVLL